MPSSATLVIGGARSGKSREAERLLAEQADVTYVATAGPVVGTDDTEWAQRVAAHRSRRPTTWTTVETLDLAPLLADAAGPVLVDCLTLWLTGVMDRYDAWESPAAAALVDKEVDALVAAVDRCVVRLVLVTNEVGQGVVPATASGRLFRDTMGTLNARVAEVCGEVRWCVAGRVLVL